jgi:hypothetical protein
MAGLRRLPSCSIDVVSNSPWRGRECLTHDPGRRVAALCFPRGPDTDGVAAPGPRRSPDQGAARAAAGIGEPTADGADCRQRGGLGASVFHDANRCALPYSLSLDGVALRFPSGGSLVVVPSRVGGLLTLSTSAAIPADARDTVALTLRVN